MTTEPLTSAQRNAWSWWQESVSSWYLFLETLVDDHWKASGEKEPGSYASEIFGWIRHFRSVGHWNL